MVLEIECKHVVAPIPATSVASNETEQMFTSFFEVKLYFVNGRVSATLNRMHFPSQQQREDVLSQKKIPMASMTDSIVGVVTDVFIEDKSANILEYIVLHISSSRSYFFRFLWQQPTTTPVTVMLAG